MTIDETMHNLYHCATCGEIVTGYAEVEAGKIYHTKCHPLARWKDDAAAELAFRQAVNMGAVFKDHSLRGLPRIKLQLIKRGKVVTGAWVPVMVYIKACEVMR